MSDLWLFPVSSPMGEGSQAVAGCWVVWGQLVHQAVLGEALDVRLAPEGTPSHGLVL